MVDKRQLFLSMNSFIEVKNYGNKTISKNDVERVIVYEKQNEIKIRKFIKDHLKENFGALKADYLINKCKKYIILKNSSSQ